MAFALLPLPATAFGVQFGAAPYRLRTATHRLPISSCGAAAKVAPHFHKAAAPTSWGRSHSRIAAYLHGIRSFIVFFRSNAVAVSPLVMHISATTVNNRIMRAPWLCRALAFCSLDLTAGAISVYHRERKGEQFDAPISCRFWRSIDSSQLIPTSRMHSTIAIAVRHRSNCSFCCALKASPGLAGLQIILDGITHPSACSAGARSRLSATDAMG